MKSLCFSCKKQKTGCLFRTAQQPVEIIDDCSVYESATEQTSKVETDKPNLCDTCIHNEVCEKHFNYTCNTECSDYKSQAQETDKTRKEQAESDIVSILERLNGQLEMRIAGVVVQNESLEGYKPSVTILLK